MVRWAKNRSGFSLVELIIVIAILAALAAILAPQYFQYVEKTRKGACENNICEIERMANIAYISGDYETYEAALNAKLAEFKSSNESKCQSGGTYSVQGDMKSGYYISCSVHGESTPKAAADYIADAFKNEPADKDRNQKTIRTALESYITLNSGAMGDKTKAVGIIADYVKTNYGFDLSDRTWQIAYNKTAGTYTVAMTIGGAVGEADNGKSVDVVKYTYNFASGEYISTENGTMKVAWSIDKDIQPAGGYYVIK